MYKYNCDVVHGWAIFKEGSGADSEELGMGNDKGGVVGTSEWIWMDEESGRRIVAALNYFEGVPTEEIEKMITNK